MRGVAGGSWTTRPDRGGLNLDCERDGRAFPCRAVERVDHACLRGRVSAAEERRRTRERTRLQKVLETEQRAVRSSDSEVARLEQDVTTARSRLARAEAELERATTKQESVRARLTATQEALDALS